MNGKPASVIQQLHALGYFIEVHHERFDPPINNSGHHMQAVNTPVQARTVVQIKESKDTEPLTEGVAECDVLDQFNRTIGLRIALGRALHAAPELKAKLAEQNA